MKLEDLKHKAREAIEAEGNVVFAYLFGSFAKGTAGKLSDVDLGLYMDEGLGKHEAFWAAMHIAGTLEEMAGRTVEAVVLNTAPPLLRFEVVRHGALVFCADEAKQHTFVVRTVDEHADMAPMRRLFRRAFVDRVKRGEFSGQR